MSTSEAEYCRLLIEKRDRHDGAGLSLLPRLKWKLLLVVITAGYSVWAWRIDSGVGKMGAFLAGGFLAGTLVRDVQWMRVLERDWPKISRFIDWTKVEKTAAEKQQSKES